ncbi:hypothetical protein [Flavobacterium sp.]|uniref:hypothetical protein n=1 Tax=Flavobacterium sp. TaxID=239 RepID=UPI0040477306
MKEKERITREEFTIEFFELIHKFKYILFHKASNIYVENPSRMLQSMFVRYKRICSVFESIGIKIKDVKHLNDLGFIDQYKECYFDEEILSIVKNSLDDFYKIEDVKLENLKLTIEGVIQFRENYISIFEDFFGGVRIEGNIPIEERLSKGLVAECFFEHNKSIDRLNRIISLLLFPNIKEFDVSILIEKFNFPIEDFIALEHKERNED